MFTVSHLPNLGEALADAMVAFKSKTALIEADRDRETARWSYREVWIAAEHFADELRGKGVEPGDRVAIVMPKPGAVAPFGDWHAVGWGGDRPDRLQADPGRAGRFAATRGAEGRHRRRIHRVGPGSRADGRHDAVADAGVHAGGQKRSAEGVYPGRSVTPGHGVHRVFVGHQWPAEGVHALARELPRAGGVAGQDVSVRGRGPLLLDSTDEPRHRLHVRVPPTIDVGGRHCAPADVAGAVSDVHDASLRA